MPISFTPPGRTKQSFKDECDIHTIMRRYELGGVLPPAQADPVYADVTGADFMAAQLIITRATSQFFDMPAKVRDRFDNDPATFLAFMEDARNHSEARELGLLPPQPAESPAAPAAPTPAPAPAAPVNSPT